MKFLLGIYIDEKQEAAYTTEDWHRLDRGYEAFSLECKKRGFRLEGGALMPPSTASTVRVRSGKLLVTDGPFAETKEQMGGYFLLECPSLDDAIAMARLTPGAQSNCVEVRTVVESQ